MSVPSPKILRNEKFASPEFRCSQLLKYTLRKYCIDFLLLEIFSKVNADNYEYFKELIVSKKKFYHASSSSSSAAAALAAASNDSSCPEKQDFPSSSVFDSFDKTDITPSMKNKHFATSVAKWIFCLFYQPIQAAVACSSSSSSSSSRSHQQQDEENFEALTPISYDGSPTSSQTLATKSHQYHRHVVAVLEYTDEIARVKSEIVDNLVATKNISFAFDLVRHLITTLARSKSTTEEAKLMRKTIVSQLQDCFGRRHCATSSRDSTAVGAGAATAFDDASLIYCEDKNKKNRERNFVNLLCHLYRINFITSKVVNFVLFTLLDHKFSFDLIAREIGGEGEGEVSSSTANGDRIIITPSNSSSSASSVNVFRDVSLFCTIMLTDSTVYEKMSDDVFEDFYLYVATGYVHVLEKKVLPVVQQACKGVGKKEQNKLDKTNEKIIQPSDSRCSGLVDFHVLERQICLVLEIAGGGWQKKTKPVQIEGEQEGEDANSAVRLGLRLDAELDSCLELLKDKIRERESVHRCLDFFKSNLSGMFYTHSSRLSSPQVAVVAQLRLPKLLILELQATLLERISEFAKKNSNNDMDCDDYSSKVDASAGGERLKNNGKAQEEQLIQQQQQKQQNEDDKGSRPSPPSSVTPLKESSLHVFDSDLEAIRYYKKVIEYRKQQAQLLMEQTEFDQQQQERTRNEPQLFPWRNSMPSSPVTQQNQPIRTATATAAASSSSFRSTPLSPSWSSSSSSGSEMKMGSPLSHESSVFYERTKKNSDDDDDDDEGITLTSRHSLSKKKGSKSRT